MKKRRSFCYMLSFCMILLLGCSDSVTPVFLTRDLSDKVMEGVEASDKELVSSGATDDSSSVAAVDPLAGVDWSKSITVSFDPYDGDFYYSSTHITGNPYRLETTPGPVSEPSIKPYKEGHKFMGWYSDYNTWQNKWDFNTVITDTMSLYAYFVQSSTPDEKPTVSQVSNNLYDMGLEPTPITDFDAGKKVKTLWVTGVNENEGWQDHEQYTNNCWGTTSSQMLDWFFNQPNFKEYLEKNGNAPKDIPSTRKWFLDLHGEWPWLVDSALGAYFNKLFKDQGLEKNMYNYGVGNKPFTLETLSALLYRHLSNGDMGGLTGLTFADQPHAMSLWGAEFDENGLVVALWLTSSECSDDEEVLKPRLNRYERINLSEEGHYQWNAFYEYTSSASGYKGTQQIFVLDIYMLTFLNATDASY